jgi:cytochrome c-type biogenesis protein CcmE
MKIKEKRISEKQIKIAIVILIVVIVIGILMWGMVPEKIYDVSEILDSPENFDGKKVNVMGLVGNWEIQSSNFTLVDSQDENIVINISNTKVFPEGFGNKETVVVTGIFFSEAFYIETQSIQIGCPSKY